MTIYQFELPEGGVYWIRAAADSSAAPTDLVGSTVVATMQDGEDIGRILKVAEYDPKAHGETPPAFVFARLLTERDQKTIADNEKLATSMRNLFLRLARPVAPDLDVVYSRTSLSRARFFMRYSTRAEHPDFRPAMAELNRLYGVHVFLWVVSPRENVAKMGALGPCGRACCCATWFKDYNTLRDANRFTLGAFNESIAMGICNRPKCCLAFSAPPPGAKDA